MKHLLYIFALLFLIIDASFSQERFLNYNNTFQSVNTEENDNIDEPVSNFPESSGGIPCNPNTFWANNGSGSIIEYVLNGNVITNTGITYSSGGWKSLAYANSSNNFSPTFYSGDHNVYHNLYIYTGSSWASIAQNNNITFANGGGYSDHLYFTGNPIEIVGPSTRIYYYSQGSFDTVYIAPPNRNVTVADLAVDMAGNCYFFVGPDINSADTIVVVSPTGTIVKKYPVSFPSYNAYGCFMMGNVLYVGLGNVNQSYPLTLLPITLNSNSAVIGTPIPFAGSINFADLESCNQGMPLGINPAIEKGEVSIYPLPAYSDINVAFSLQKEASVKLELLNCLGQLVQTLSYDGMRAGENKISISIEGLSQGFYFLKINVDGNTMTKKILKI